MTTDSSKFDPSDAVDLVKRFVDSAKAVLPESISNDVRANLQAAIQEIVGELEVVTREELQTQKEVLKKTRSKVQDMEKVISELERKLAESQL